MNEDLHRKPVKSSSWLQRYLIYAAVLLIVFLLGLVPMWLKARTAANSLADAQHQLALAKMQNDLASAVIDARRGDYEPARQALSRFFTSLRADLDQGNSSNYTEAQRNSLQSMFAGRDELITLLARSDPAAADRLSDMFLAYRKTMNG
jgi:Na+-transporting NADH:ubiquinone oxidoreductase subunit NqrC